MCVLLEGVIIDKNDDGGVSDGPLIPFLAFWQISSDGPLLGDQINT